MVSREVLLSGMSLTGIDCYHSLVSTAITRCPYPEKNSSIKIQRVFLPSWELDLNLEMYRSGHQSHAYRCTGKELFESSY